MNLLNRKNYFNACGISLLMIFLCVAYNFAQISSEISKKQTSIASNQNKLKTKNHKIKREVFPYKIGDATVKIVVNKTSPQIPKFVYFNMHDNENTAVEAATEVIKTFGGTLVELQHDGERLIKFSLKDKRFSFDPNRIFTAAGIEQTLKFNGQYSIEAQTEVERFVEKLKGFLKNAKLIIAVHNNTDENYSIKSYDKNGEFQKDIKSVNVNSKFDSDDFFYVTDDKFYKTLKEKNQNVAFQDNAKVADDGSLAVFCGKNKISYINVESEHEHLADQIKMLEILQKVLKNFNQVKTKTQRK